MKQEQKLDPYKIGAITGPAAFSADDYIVLVKEGNKPAKVRYRNSDVLQSIKIILGDETDSVYGEENYLAADLGYPLSSALWSEHQKEWYKKCHTEQWLKQRWQKQSFSNFGDNDRVLILQFFLLLLIGFYSMSYLFTQNRAFTRLFHQVVDRLFHC